MPHSVLLTLFGYTMRKLNMDELIATCLACLEGLHGADTDRNTYTHMPASNSMM